jgi:hypothetical protein
LDFDCDNENDDVEYGVAGKDPTVPALPLNNYDNDLLVDNCDPDDDDDGVDDEDDDCRAGATGWVSDASTDLDGDGCRDADEDVCVDPDNDNFATAPFTKTGCTGIASNCGMTGNVLAAKVYDNCPTVSNPDQSNVCGVDMPPCPPKPPGNFRYRRQ